ncbi:ATP-binding protein [Roseobacter ponti]|uniref:ATP-binding protein n=1 Tax=Roseobacter ponti TaxID=1891787 RepID=A0A858SMH8_9RHOB|nr:ATP-binding protein [Roseobacter ponti]QJF49905.1 ATP-binding protein [Roseobacter ponti]
MSRNVPPRPAGAQTLPSFEVSLRSSDLAVREALARILTELDPLSLDIEETGTVELVLAEVLNNIVEHAYPAETEGGPIRIFCQPAQDGLHVRITDCGAAMPEGHLPLGRAVEVDVDFSELPEGGFGWFLIQDLAKDVEYVRVGAQNRLSMRLPVGMLV